MCATRSPSSRSTPAPRRSPSRSASATWAPAAARFNSRASSASRPGRARAPGQSRRPPLRVRAPLFLLQGEGAAVDAVALAAFVGGAVVEDVAEVGVAVLADDLGAAHEEAVVRPQFDVLEVGRLGEAGPAGAGVELGVRGEELGAAADTSVHPVGLLVPVGAGEGALGPGVAGHLVLLGRQLLAPLLLGFLDLRRHPAPFSLV